MYTVNICFEMNRGWVYFTKPLKISRCPRPSDYMYCADKADKNSSGVWNQNGATYYAKDYIVSFRHNQLSNCVFIDGHVESNNRTGMGGTVASGNRPYLLPDSGHFDYDK